jgi:hypothetical protein
MHMKQMTPKEVLQRLIHNDVRNLAEIQPHRWDLWQRVTVDCAGRYVEALDFGDSDILRQAEGNLRIAVKSGRP